MKNETVCACVYTSSPICPIHSRDGLEFCQLMKERVNKVHVSRIYAIKNKSFILSTLCEAKYVTIVCRTQTISISHYLSPSFDPYLPLI